MRRNDASWLRAIAVCSALALAVGCGDEEGQTPPTDAGRGDAGGDGGGDSGAAPGVDCTGASATAGETPAIQTCGISSCHNPDFAGQRESIGFASSNITPDETGLAEWTVSDIATATLDGITPEGEELCPIMIRYRTAGMSEAEACDIAAYLKTVEPIENVVVDTCN